MFLGGYPLIIFTQRLMKSLSIPSKDGEFTKYKDLQLDLGNSFYFCKVYRFFDKDYA